MGASQEQPHSGADDRSDNEWNDKAIRHGDDANRQALANIGSVDRSHIDADCKYERNLEHHGDAKEESEALQCVPAAAKLEADEIGLIEGHPGKVKDRREYHARDDRIYPQQVAEICAVGA